MIDAGRLRGRFLGSLLGAALGDAVGASREGCGLADGPELDRIGGGSGQLRYTDDTHMTIGVAESLVECGGFDGAHMAKRFVKNYCEEPWRGYGPGPPRVFRMLKGGQPWDRAASALYGGGSFGNGSAMRVAPVGLFLWDRPVELREVAHLSSLITHSHALGMEGAAVQAKAVALAVAESPGRDLDAESFATKLLDVASHDEFGAKVGAFTTLLERADDRPAVVRALGHGIEAFNSVPTAIFCFLSHPRDFAATVVYAVGLGGDTDTIASMAGAIAGAYLGLDALPAPWLARLENRDYLTGLGERLWQAASAARDP